MKRYTTILNIRVYEIFKSGWLTTPNISESYGVETVSENKYDCKTNNIHPLRSMADFILYMTVKEDSHCQIRIKHLHSGLDIRLDSLLEAIFFMQEKMDEINFPQSQMEQRCWNGETDYERERTLLTGKIIQKVEPLLLKRDVTFLIQVKFRQNASWQGNIQWVEQKLERHFRSVLEIMTLILEALQETEKNIYDEKILNVQGD